VPSAQGREGAAAAAGEAGGRERGAAAEGGGRHAGLYPFDGVVFVEGFCNTCRVAK